MKLESSLSDRAGMLYVAPAITVLFLLLIFFLFGSNLVLRSGVALHLPTSDSLLPSAENANIVTLIPGNSDEIYLNDHRLKIDQLPEQVDSIKERSNQVVILGDVSSIYGQIMELSHFFLKQGFDVAHATHPEVTR